MHSKLPFGAILCYIPSNISGDSQGREHQGQCQKSRICHPCHPTCRSILLLGLLEAVVSANLTLSSMCRFVNAVTSIINYCGGIYSIFSCKHLCFVEVRQCLNN